MGKRPTNNQAAHAAEGVEKIDVKAVNTAETRKLYKKREKIHPKAARGRFRKLKWAIMVLTLGIYYLAPWIRWDRGPGAPDQAILLDLPARKFYFFFIEIWPQEFYYVTGLLIIAALGLFLATALAGRVWCGYACPQTVWTDLFIWIERKIEGDRNARIKLDKAPWTAGKIAKRVIKHVLWLLVGALTGGAWVFYFADAPTLARELLTFSAPPVAYITIAVLTLTTYLFGGFAREQVCTYMCPWPRIQGSMFDEQSLLVTYHPKRGEPRGKHKKGESWDNRGHCIDCKQCVAVCPMGIDIRDGLQLECINCALCIDACDAVMDKLGLPRGLIGYDTVAGLEAVTHDDPYKKTRPKFIRGRTIVYTLLIALVGGGMLYTLLNRGDLELNVLRDRNPLYITLKDGSIRDGYTIKVLNKAHKTRKLELDVIGLPEATLKMIGLKTKTPQKRLPVTVGPDQVKSLRVFVIVPPDKLASGAEEFDFRVKDTETGLVLRHESVFRGPKK